MTTAFSLRRGRLLAGAALFVTSAIPAHAQDAGTAPATSPPAAGTLTAGPNQPGTVTTAQSDNAAVDPAEEIVVTGTIFRRTNTETVSPVSVLSAANLQSRGLTTVADAVQTISAGNGGGIPQNFTGAFASGSQSISLRALTTNSTLTLFDGLRAASYPLADDGQRSFVDLNTIPSAIVDRVEVLKDGASSTYGADAIAGVVNIILKKEIKGIQGRVEAGAAERGYAGNQRLQLTAGYGDLSEQGFNVYVSGEYQHNAAVYNNDVRFPYNTNNLLSIDAGNGFVGRNGNFGYTPPTATSSSGATVAIVRPATLSTTRTDIPFGTAIAGGQFQVLGSCASQGLTPHTNSTGTYCEQDLVNQYGVIAPEQTRFGGTFHATANLNDETQAYFVGTFYQSKVTIAGTPQSIRSNGNPVETRGISLPARLSNGQLNVQNPYAASGQAALIYYRFGDIPTSLTNTARTYRAATGIDGALGDGWAYSVSGTYMRTDLDQDQSGLLYIPGLVSAINNGTYNFVNPSLNTQAVRDSIGRTLSTRASSELGQLSGTITRDLFEIVPGQPIQLGVGGQVRYEKINDPTRVPNRDYITVNPFQAVGDRYVYASFFELNAPITNSIEINASGRYDKYSDVGFSRFSPKIGGKFKPIPEVAFRGTYSRGFRAPSIPEVSGSVIGFTQYTPGVGVPANAAQLRALYGNNSYITTQYGLGNNSTGNPDVKPETSRSFTGGIVVQPASWLSFTVDYYNIRKKNLILSAGGNPAAIADNYLLTGVIPDGVGITLNPIDPDHPNLRATPLSVDFLYSNGNVLKTDGIDVEVNLSVPISDTVKFTSVFSGTRINKYNIDDGTGTGIQKFVGTLASYSVTSASGTPRYRANWQNTIETGPFSLTGTAYYTSGYKGYADDNSGPGSSCANAIETSAQYSADLVTTTTGAALDCKTGSFIQLDLVGQFKVNDNFTFYVNVVNALNAKAPFDPNTYGGNNYNPAWSSAGVVGRLFRGGATFKF